MRASAAALPRARRHWRRGLVQRDMILEGSAERHHHRPLLLRGHCRSARRRGGGGVSGGRRLSDAAATGWTARLLRSGRRHCHGRRCCCWCCPLGAGQRAVAATAAAAVCMVRPGWLRTGVADVVEEWVERCALRWRRGRHGAQHRVEELLHAAGGDGGPATSALDPLPVEAPRCSVRVRPVVRCGVHRGDGL